MAINNFSTLKTAVQNWIDRTDIADRVDEFISLGEARIYRELRIRAMETALSDTISSGVIGVPADFRALKHAYVNGSPTQWLEEQKAEFIYENYPTRSVTSKPRFIAQDGGNFIFGPYPDSAYTIKGTYYAALTALGTVNETNWFTTNAPDLLLFAALTEAAGFEMNDEKEAKWLARYEQTKNRIQKEDNRQLRGALRAMPG
jgi:hypothetical protein